MKRGLSIQYILSFNLLLLMGIMIALALTARWLSSKHKEKLLMESKMIIAQRVKTMLNLQIESKTLTIDDYTFWDEMVHFVKTKDQGWANANIRPMMDSYDFNFAIIYNDLSHPEWLATNEDDALMLNLVKTQDVCKILTHPGSYHWYTKQQGHTFEIFASTIHPTDDPEHLTPPQGVFLAGHKIDSTYMSRLSAICEATISLIPITHDKELTEETFVDLILPLPDFDKAEGNKLYVSQKQDFLALYNQWSKTFLLVLIISVAIILLVYHLTLIKWVSQPLTLISQVLSKAMPLANIAGIYKYGKEYQQIGEIITKNTEQRREMVRLKEKAEESDRLKSVFLANMSHEIRTPINGIIGFAELICNESDATNRMEFKQIIKSCAHDLIHIMDDIIELSKIDAGALQLTPHHFSLSSTMNELDSLYSHMIASKSKPIRLIVEHPVSDIVLFADGYRIKQMLGVLLDNAVKFTDKGHIELTYKLTDQHITFKVKDTGIGIKKEKRDVIFERFRQSDEQMARQHGGNGLGLAIFKKLADMMGATVTLISESGKGSTFKLAIPLSLMTEHRGELTTDTTSTHAFALNDKERNDKSPLRSYLNSQHPFIPM